MFLYKLNKIQGEKFLVLANHLASSDNIVSIKEKELISRMKYEMNINEDIIINKYDNNDTLIEFDSYQSKIICLQELVGIAYADGVFCNDEYSFLKNISNIFHINEGKLEKINSWVQKTLKVTKEGWDLQKE